MFVVVTKLEVGDFVKIEGNTIVKTQAKPEDFPPIQGLNY